MCIGNEFIYNNTRISKYIFTFINIVMYSISEFNSIQFKYINITLVI